MGLACPSEVLRSEADWHGEGLLGRRTKEKV
jgi:hypothetical protein